MVRIRLNKNAIFAFLYSEEELSDLSLMESFYEIRKLKALADSLENGFVEADIEGEQAYCEKYDIWFQSYSYDILK